MNRQTRPTMKTNRIKATLLAWNIFALTLSSPAAPPTPEGSPQDGGVIGSTYTNAYFRFAVTVPDQWTVAKLPKVNELARSHRKRLATSADSALRDAATGEPSAQLLMMSRFPLDTRSSSNVLFSIVARRVPPNSRTLTGKDYLIQTTRSITASKSGFAQVGEISQTTVGGKTFHRVRYARGERLLQENFVATLKGHALDFILTATNEDDMNRLQAVIGTVKFY